MTVRVEVNQADLMAVDDGVVERAVRFVLSKDDVRSAHIAVTFVDDVAIQELNRTYLDHDWPTDVLSFALDPDVEAPSDTVSGDIYVGADRARAQAAELEITAAEEAVRLAVHGTLHLLGHDHPEDQRETSPFFKRQEEIVAQLLSVGAEAGLDR